MKKTIEVEIDVCDCCKDREVARYSTGRPRICDICGKVLCHKCATGFDHFVSCPECKKTTAKQYFTLEAQINMLQLKLAELSGQRETELDKLVDIISKRRHEEYNKQQQKS